MLFVSYSHVALFVVGLLFCLRCDFVGLLGPWESDCWADVADSAGVGAVFASEPYGARSVTLELLYMLLGSRGARSVWVADRCGYST